jgi:hypothetical protein
VQFVGDLCASSDRYYCDPYVDTDTAKYAGQCRKNTSQFEYYPTYIQFPGRPLL